MFTSRTLPLWVAIIVLASMYLMGQGWSPDTEPTARVPKTGQTTSYYTGDDGDLQAGAPWPVPRFTNNGNGTVTDNLTDLIWTQDADCHSGNWYSALDYCNALAHGTCGLTDASVAGDWRLANRFEQESLLDMENIAPTLPTGHPFTGVSSGNMYWSSTTDAFHTYLAWGVAYGGGSVFNADKEHITTSHVWCVRGGQ